MQFVVLPIVSFLAAILTFYTGFGLGTLLLPAFAFFMPVKAAVAGTASVHLANNLLKVFLTRKGIVSRVVLRFGVPAMFAAFGGAYLLVHLDATAAKVVIGVLILLFGVLELGGWSEKAVFGEKWLPLGGVLSGFFGGVSGHQGAFRSMFLLSCNLEKEEYVATAAAIACLVDIARLGVYVIGVDTTRGGYLLTDPVVYVAMASAFAGTMVGNRLLKKVTMKKIRLAAGVLLFLVGLALTLRVI